MWEAGATQGGLIQKGSVTDNGSTGRSLSLSEKGAMNVGRRKPDCTHWCRVGNRNPGFQYEELGLLWGEAFTSSSDYHS